MLSVVISPINLFTLRWKLLMVSLKVRIDFLCLSKFDDITVFCICCICRLGDIAPMDFVSVMRLHLSMRRLKCSLCLVGKLRYLWRRSWVVLGLFLIRYSLWWCWLWILWRINLVVWTVVVRLAVRREIVTYIFVFLRRTFSIDVGALLYDDLSISAYCW